MLLSISEVSPHFLIKIVKTDNNLKKWQYKYANYGNISKNGLNYLPKYLG